MDYKKENNEENKSNEKFLKLKKFHSFLINNTNNKNIISNNIKDEENNIYFKYLQNPDIIFQSKDNDVNNNLEKIFKELNDDIDNGNNIILPFLENICQNLVKAYIESDFDDHYSEEYETPSDKGEKLHISSTKSCEIESLYLIVFKKMKYNCFIHKQAIIKIYEYFSSLYHKFNESNEIKDDDKIIRKLYKVMNLFKIFYEKENNENKSSICSLGGNIKISLFEKIELSKGYKLSLKIHILSFYFEEIIKNLYLIKINDVVEKYDCILKNLENQELKSIHFIITSDKIDIEFNTNKREMKIVENVKLDEIQDIYIFESFFGQISSIDISLSFDKKKVNYYFRPISIRNDNFIYYYKKKIPKTDNKTLNNTIPRIIINDKRLVKINYLNYNDKKFDIIDYFGGIIQFLPFYYIINNLKDSKIYKINDDVDKLKESNTESVNTSKNNDILKEYLNNFGDFIIKIIIKKLLLIQNGFKYFKKYAIMVYYLLLNLDLDLILALDFNKEKENENENEIENEIKNMVSNYVEFLKRMYFTQKNAYAFNTQFELDELIKFDDIKTEIELNIFKAPGKQIKQLYRHFMKKLFVFNNFWSNKNIFFKKEKSKEIKYKQINYYTKNFQLPYFYPVLEISRYYPKFSQLKDGIFLGKDINMLEYDFEIIANKRTKEVINLLIKKVDINNGIACCLIKNSHHVPGAIFFFKNKEYNKNKKFKLIFQTILKEKCETCNKKNIQDNNLIELNNPKNKNILCYGAVFACPEKEKNRNIIIKSKNILFLLYRIYFHRVSAIEIFTINNKSYYFNFQNPFDNNNIKKHPILNELRLSGLFKEIKTKKEKLGLYNIKYESYLFPIFKDDIHIWDKKIKYLCNYDLIILINIFSNRSFRDIYQYPIFPSLYNLIKVKRNMGEQIGFQDMTEESRERRRVIIRTYDLKDEENEENENEPTEEQYLFNIHYSNPAFVFNYLLRVLPYSFLAVEFQGSDFDNPNRLFYSIEKALKSNLSLKSDLREMIPELYYMTELFYNKNNILFENLYDGSKIDYVEIISKTGSNSETNIQKMEDMFNFICEIRKSLEEEKELNKWINIIFGNKQKFSVFEGKQYQNYDKNSEINFKNDKNIINNKYALDLCDFGLLPYPLFNKDFPLKETKTFIKNDLNNLNLEFFTEEHINQINSPIDSFICKGSTLINNNYIQLIDAKEQINILDFFDFPNKFSQKFDIDLFNRYVFINTFGFLDITIDKHKSFSNLINYYFVGNIFGKVSIYSLLKAKRDKNEKKGEYKEINNFEIEIDDEEKIKKIKYWNNNLNKDEYIYNNTKLKRIIFPISKNNKKIFEFELKLIKTLYDHSKEIKYIDFNPRLNLLLTYSLDNYINIYIFPKFKLINVIDTNCFKVKNDVNYFNEVILLSYPFPMIICYNKEYIYLLSINGELIKYEKLEKHLIVFYVDKKLGLAEDMVQIFDSKGMHVFNSMKK